MAIFSGSHSWGQTAVLLLPVELLTSQLTQANGRLFVLQDEWYEHRTARKLLRSFHIIYNAEQTTHARTFQKSLEI